MGITQATSAPADTLVITYAPRGAGRDIFALRAPELLICGPAGTGKSRSCLEKLHLCASKYPGARCLMLRKTRRSLTESGIVTWDTKVQPHLDGVHFNATKQQYQYPNGSVVSVAGLDKPGKIMSSEWDLIYVQEATELSEQDWEALTTRLRNGKMPYQQLLADCNPDAPTHWLIQRVQAGRTLMLESRHEDNPTVTPEYLARLDALSGVRYLRLRLGVWAAAEGMVYQDSWDRARNLVDRAAVCAPHSNLQGDCGVPRSWRRYMALDFGYNHSFVCQWWAEDGDGRLYRYRELYMSHRLVEDHAREILRVMGYELVGGRPVARGDGRNSDPLPYAVYCDHDAEDRYTLERHTGLATIPAYKDVPGGIQAVAARLRPAGDDRPRAVLLRDSLIERDRWLTDAKLPACTEEEVESYVWNLHAGRTRGEEPVKEHDHGLDAMRYLIATLDRQPSGYTYGPRLFG